MTRSPHGQLITDVIAASWSGSASVTLANNAAAIELVGPKGYEHGWHYVGQRGR